MKELVFVTGNPSKADYLSRIVNYPLGHFQYDHPEVQAWTLESIVEEKARAAYERVGKAVLVEDVSLGLDEHGGMPGPFIKFYIEPDPSRGEQDNEATRNMKLERFCRLADSSPARRATAACVIGYYDGDRLELLRGELRGTIANHPRGQNGFGWDAVFCPDGYGGKTRAELAPSDDAKTYATIKPLDALRNLLTSLQ